MLSGLSPAFELSFFSIDGSGIFILVFRGFLKEPSQCRNENSSSSSFAVSMPRVPAPDCDGFWKFIRFLLYLFFNVSKTLAADPIKRKVFFTYTFCSRGYSPFHTMRFFPIYFFIPFVAFVIKAGEFSYLLSKPFFFFKIRFNHISKIARIYLDQY